MARLDVIIVDATGNKEQKVGLPDDVRCGVIMVKLVEKINLPSLGPDGNPISYKFIHKVTGKQLLETQTLAEAGIKSGDVLRLQPEITAGAGELNKQTRRTGVWKTILSVCLVLLLAFSLFACGKSTSGEKDADAQDAMLSESAQNVSEAEKETEAPTEAEEVDPYVTSIDLTTQAGNLQYVKFEPAADGLITPYSGSEQSFEFSYVFSFAFKNFSAKPSQCQDAFRIQFFQNGVELDGNYSYSSKGGKQYDLVGAYFNNAMKDGTVTFGKIVVGTDDSPITIMVSEKGNSDNYQMQEVSLTDTVDKQETDTKTAESPTVSEEKIDEALQGVWNLSGQGTFTFLDGDFSLFITEANQTLSGTYSVNLEESQIDATVSASDGNVNIHFPFTFENGVLTLKNNQGEALVKQ